MAKNGSVFNHEIIKACTLITFRQRLWGAWNVLIGRAGIVFFEKEDL